MNCRIGECEVAAEPHCEIRDPNCSRCDRRRFQAAETAPCVGSGSIDSPNSSAASHATARQVRSRSAKTICTTIGASYPLMPNTLDRRGHGPSGGLLVSEVYRFSELVVLAKFSKCTFEGEVRPGDTLTLPGQHRAGERFRRLGHRERRHRRRRPSGRSRDLLRPPRPPTRTEQTDRHAYCSTPSTCSIGSGSSACSTSASAPTAPASAPKTTGTSTPNAQTPVNKF